jgi:hypothetical protein
MTNNWKDLEEHISDGTMSFFDSSMHKKTQSLTLLKD